MYQYGYASASLDICILYEQLQADGNTSEIACWFMQMQCHK